MLFESFSPASASATASASGARHGRGWLLRASAALAAVMVAVAVTACLCLSGCQKQAVDTSEGYALLKEGRLSVVVTLDSPPYESLSGSDPDGLGVAVVRELAQRMGLELDLRRIDASNHEEGQLKCLDALVADEADVALGSFVKGTIDSSDVDYTLPYHELNVDVVVLPGTFGSLDELGLPGETDEADEAEGSNQAGGAGEPGDPSQADASAKTDASDQAGRSTQAGEAEETPAERAACVVPAKVACVSGSPAWRQAEEIPGIEVVGFRDAAACKEALEQRQVRAVVLDSSQAASAGLAQPTFELLERVMVSDRFVLAVSRIDTGLANAISAELEEMRADGTLERLRAEYLH